MKALKKVTSEESLASFGIWYVERYMPSKAKLSTMLYTKSENAQWVPSVLQLLESYIDDRKNLEAKIRFDLERGVSVKKLLAKYLPKGFLKNDIVAVIEALPKNENTRLTEIYKKIDRSIQDGKSKKETKMALRYLYPENEELIFEYIENSFPSDEEQLDLYYQKERAKIVRNTWEEFSVYEQKEAKKLFDSLLRKGFSYESVKKFLRVNE